MGIGSTQGYREEASRLVGRYESISFADKHRAALHLIPSAPCDALDVGAGTGADAAWLASSGHRVVAVEPVDELRLPGMALHPSPAIEWIEDSLPGLAQLQHRQHSFDLVMITAVWMHLDETERREAMPIVAALLRQGGKLILSLRHGPVPAGRRMFEVSAAETIRLAEACRLRTVLDVRTESIQEENRRAGVTWSQLGFVREASG